MTTQLTRMQGCFIGLAIGDALGAQVEFSPRGVLVTDYGTPGPWNLPYGGWTDDTAQALCIAESLILNETREQAMDRLCRWMTEGYNSCTGKAVGIGGTVLKSLQTYRVTGMIVPPTDEHSAGNGCIMRIAPVAIYYNFRMTGGIRKFPEQHAKEWVTLTHGAKDAIKCGQLFVGMLDCAINGYHKEAILRTHHTTIDKLWNREYITKTDIGTVDHKFGNTYYSNAELISDGYCVNTLECALWAFYHTDTFEDGMIKAISLGGDTDTVGAVYGQLAGAYYGYDNIPQRWRDGVMWHDKILELTEQLTQLNPNERKLLDEQWELCK